MKKKSTCNSAFFNLRVLVALNIFLAGVFLALFATSADSGRTRRGEANPAGSDPVISVTPDSLSVTLQQGQMESRILTIANLGGTTLNWDQFGGPGCVLPSQWVSAQPFGGSIPPGQSQEMTVTFNAANVLSGTYTATLCLTSNDPVNPVVTVPLTLTVTATEGARILFNQSLFSSGQSGSEAGAPTQRLVPPGAFDAEGADDFPIPDPEGWTISEFNFELRLGTSAFFPVNSLSWTSACTPTITANQESRMLHLQRHQRRHARHYTAPGTAAGTVRARPGCLLGLPATE